MKKYQLTEDMTQDRKYWITKIMAGRAQGYGGCEMMHMSMDVHLFHLYWPTIATDGRGTAATVDEE